MNNSTNSNNNDKCKLYVKLQHVINSNFNINRKKQVQGDKKNKKWEDWPQKLPQRWIQSLISFVVKKFADEIDFEIS